MQRKMILEEPPKQRCSNKEHAVERQHSIRSNLSRWRIWQGRERNRTTMNRACALYVVRRGFIRQQDTTRECIGRRNRRICCRERKTQGR